MLSLIGYLALTLVRNPEPIQGITKIKFNDAKEITRDGYIGSSTNKSFGGVLFNELLSSAYHSERKEGGFIVSLIPKGMNSFVGELGVDDERGYSETFRFPSSYVISLDDKEVKRGELEPKAKPIHLSLDVSSAKTIRIELFQAAGIGDPIFSKAISAQPSKPTLLSPENKADVSGSKVELQWSKVPDAVSYSVEVVNTSWEASDDSSPRIWSTTTKDTKYQLDLKGLPKGKYRWSVLAFGSKKVLGEWSTERSFTLTD